MSQPGRPKEYEKRKPYYCGKCRIRKIAERVGLCSTCKKAVDAALKLAHFKTREY